MEREFFRASEGCDIKLVSKKVFTLATSVGKTNSAIKKTTTTTTTTTTKTAMTK